MFITYFLVRDFEVEGLKKNENFLQQICDDLQKKYPKAKLKAKITNIDEIDFAKDGTYNATVEGELTIKGITNKINEKGTRLSIFDLHVSYYNLISGYILSIFTIGSQTF